MKSCVTIRERNWIIKAANDQGRGFAFAYLNNTDYYLDLFMLRAVAQTWQAQIEQIFNNTQAGCTFCLPALRISCSINNKLFQASGVQMRAIFLSPHDQLEFEKPHRALCPSCAISQEPDEKALTVFPDRKTNSLAFTLTRRLWE
jgi:hypothetical protein